MQTQTDKATGSGHQPGAASVLHGVASQLLQPLAVRGPGGGGVGGDATVVVEVYALGRGVALAGERGHLPGAEGTFELEGHGKRLVIDMLGAVKAHWLVAPVQSYVVPIGQLVQAVDEEKLSEFGFGLGHSALHAKTAILSLPQGWGKTTIAHEMAARLGCLWVADDWCFGPPLVHGALHLTNQDISELVGLPV